MTTTDRDREMARNIYEKLSPYPNDWQESVDTIAEALATAREEGRQEVRAEESLEGDPHGAQGHERGA
jgi:hypothetical protein